MGSLNPSLPVLHFGAAVWMSRWISIVAYAIGDPNKLEWYGIGLELQWKEAVGRSRSPVEWSLLWELFMAVNTLTWA